MQGSGGMGGGRPLGPAQRTPFSCRLKPLTERTSARGTAGSNGNFRKGTNVLTVTAETDSLSRGLAVDGTVRLAVDFMGI